MSAAKAVMEARAAGIQLRVEGEACSFAFA